MTQNVGVGQEESQSQFQNPIDDEVEKVEKKLPRIYDVLEYDESAKRWNKKDLKIFIKTKDYEIADLFLHSADGTKVIWTYILAVIAPLKQLKPLYVEDTPTNHGLKYFVIEGEGFISVSNMTRHIGKNKCFSVEKGVYHNIINISERFPLVIAIDYEGLLDLRERYFPQEFGQRETKMQMNELLRVPTMTATTTTKENKSPQAQKIEGKTVHTPETKPLQATRQTKRQDQEGEFL